MYIYGLICISFVNNMIHCYVYAYMHIYVYKYIYIYIFMHRYIYVYTYTWTHMYVHTLWIWPYTWVHLSHEAYTWVTNYPRKNFLTVYMRHEPYSSVKNYIYESRTTYMSHELWVTSLVYESRSNSLRMHKLHSNRHEQLVGWIVSIVVAVLKFQQTRLYWHYWYI